MRDLYRISPILAMIAFSATVVSCGGPRDSQSSVQQQGRGASPSQARADEGYLVTSDSARLFYRLVGGGPDVVIFVHGGPGMNMEYVGRDFEPLAANHTVVLYDQRGGGRSELPSDTTRLAVERQIADLDEIRRHFHAGRVAIIAHSYGPLLAAAYALAHPSAVSRMVFIGPLPPRRGDVFARIDAEVNARLGDDDSKRAADALARMSDPAADTRRACRDWARLILRSRLVDPDRILRSHPIDIDLCASEPEALRYGWNIASKAILDSFGDWDLRDRLRQLDIPTLVIHGEHEAIPMDMVMEWTTSLPKATLLRVPRAAHFPYVERPDIVWPAIEQFLR